jgi:NADH-quinone oxidoreductase subunit F
MMPAYEAEIREALQEGVKIIPLAQPVRIIGDAEYRVTRVEYMKMKLGEFDSSGRRRSVPSDEPNQFIEADLVIPAISQYADLPFIPVEDIGRTQWGTFTVDQDTMMTTMKGVFAGGDIVRGPDSVIQAIADGKKAAIAIDRFFGGRGALNRGEEIKLPRLQDDDDVVELPRYPLDMLELEKRKGSFDEVVLGYHKLTAMAESMRCLHCERR